MKTVRLVLLVVVAMVSMAVSFYLSDTQAREWDAFRTARHCKLVDQKYLVVGAAPVTQDIWLCDGGNRYTRL